MQGGRFIINHAGYCHRDMVKLHIFLIAIVHLFTVGAETKNLRNNDKQKKQHEIRTETTASDGATLCEVAAANNGFVSKLSWSSTSSCPMYLGSGSPAWCTWTGVICDESNQVISLKLGGHSLGGTVPSAIGSLASLTRLELWANSMTGQIPTAIGSLSSLYELQLYKNNLDGTIPAAICNLPSTLNGLNLGCNRFTGSIPSCIGKFSSAGGHEAGGGQYEDTCANGGFTEGVVSFANNMLGSTLPSEICSLQGVQVFSVSGNSLQGTVPACISSMQNLGILQLNNNFLSGSIPSGLCSVTHSWWQLNLELSNNHFIGSLPDCLGTIPALKMLSVGGNSLTGSIPSSLCVATQLQQLSLTPNSFTGSVPSCLASLSMKPTPAPTMPPTGPPASAPAPVPTGPPASGPAPASAPVQLPISKPVGSPSTAPASPSAVSSHTTSTHTKKHKYKWARVFCHKVPHFPFSSSASTLHFPPFLTFFKTSS